MSPQAIQQRTTFVRRDWSENERRLRAEISRIRCAQLLAQCDPNLSEDLTLWAGGAMTLADIARIVA